MTTQMPRADIPPLAPPAPLDGDHGNAGEGGPGERLRRREARRRLMREETLAVLFLMLALAATVAVLASKWLGSGPASVALSYFSGGT